MRLFLTFWWLGPPGENAELLARVTGEAIENLVRLLSSGSRSRRRGTRL